ncbi:MAG: ethanolamine utilization acetate kinase EutQ [Deltaproteobacteria bacterium]|jgi:ethanolamine utilization protein EutQ|nr:ethanolamine utilization acetate kinase EutQ [Deltaproteobacteria bacterium]
MKRLITAAVVRQEKQAGKKRLEIDLPHCIVTPEARQVAEQIGLELVETIGAPKAAPCAADSAPAVIRATDSDLAVIRAAVMAKLPAGGVPEELVDQLIKKAVCRQAAPQQAEGAFQARTGPAGIKRIAGGSITMGIFDGAGKEKRVGIVDVVTAEDGSSMGAGFMAWENCFFPWTLTYDEVDIVLEGELHIRCKGETVVGKAGDVLFIPKNTSIEFGTPGKVKFFYVAYPANWQDA